MTGISRDALRAFEKLLAPLRRRIRLIVQRAVLEMVTDEDGVAMLQVRAGGGDALPVEFLQQFGFSSRPKQGANVVVLSLAGDRSHSLAVMVSDQRYTIDLEDGEAVMHSDEGAKVHIKQNRIIDIKADQINLLGAVEISETLTCKKAASFAKDVSITGKTTTGSLISNNLNVDTHVHNGNLGNPVGTPVAPPPPEP